MFAYSECVSASSVENLPSLHGCGVHIAGGGGTCTQCVHSCVIILKQGPTGLNTDIFNVKL